MRGPVSIPLLLLTAALLAGCLPGQRGTPRELFPADSLSRSIAASVPVDTLELVDRHDLPGEVRYPLTFAWSNDRFLVVDSQQGRVHEFDGQGNHRGVFEDEEIQFPLLAGVHGDTVAILSRGKEHVALVEMDGNLAGRIIDTIPVPSGRNANAVLHAGGIVVKIADEAEGSRLFDIGFNGEIRATHPLEGPFWRHIGYLRMWEESVVSLSGYRPVVDVLRLDAPDGAPVDTLALRGFDSPQLERSRGFVMGDVKEPPLLVPSAVAVEDRLFVLNARAGWAHVDVYRRAGDHLMLERSLLSPDLGLGRNFFAPDLAVQRVGEDYHIVILENRPRPALVRYRWQANRAEQRPEGRVPARPH